MLIDKDKLQIIDLDIMNKVHYEEVDLVNSIHDEIIKVENGSANTMLIALLDGIIDHTKLHFGNEEAMMIEHGFPALSCHKGAHETGLNRMTSVVDVYKNENDIVKLKHYFEVELLEWLTSHIATMDFVTASFLSRHI